MCKYIMLINMGGKKLTFESQSVKHYAKHFIYIISQLPTAKFLSRHFTKRELTFIKAQQFARGQPQVRKQNLTQLCKKRNSFKQSCQSVSFSSKNLMAYCIEQQAQVQKKVPEFLPVLFLSLQETQRPQFCFAEDSISTMQDYEETGYVKGDSLVQDHT